MLDCMLLFQATLAKAFVLEVSTYSGLAVALFCLAVAFALFWFVRGIDSNANSIRTNLVASLFVAYIAFVAGIDRTDPSLQVLDFWKGFHIFSFLNIKLFITVAVVIDKYVHLYSQ